MKQKENIFAGNSHTLQDWSMGTGMLSLLQITTPIPGQAVFICTAFFIKC